MMQAAGQVVGNGAVERRMSSDHIKVNPHRNSILGKVVVVKSLIRK